MANSNVTYQCVYAHLERVDQVFDLGLAVQLIIRLFDLDVEDLQLVLALLDFALRRRQLLIHVDEHISDDCSHLVFDLELLLLLLYIYQE